jgi:hypothetical protein
MWLKQEQCSYVNDMTHLKPQVSIFVMTEVVSRSQPDGCQSSLKNLQNGPQDSKGGMLIDENEKSRPSIRDCQISEIIKVNSLHCSLQSATHEFRNIIVFNTIEARISSTGYTTPSFVLLFTQFIAHCYNGHFRSS